MTKNLLEPATSCLVSDQTGADVCAEIGNSHQSRVEDLGGSRVEKAVK